MTDGVQIERLTDLEQKRFNDRLTELLREDEILSTLLEGVLASAVEDTELAEQDQLTESQMDRYYQIEDTVKRGALIAYILQVLN